MLRLCFLIVIFWLWIIASPGNAKPSHHTTHGGKNSCSTTEVEYARRRLAPAIKSGGACAQYPKGSQEFVSRKLSDFCTDDVKLLRHVPGLVAVYIVNDEIDDKDVATLSSMKNIRVVLIGSENITDRTVKHLQELPKLEKLILNGNGITDAGLESVCGMSQLAELRIRSDNVTPRGLASLSLMDTLTQVSIVSQQITIEDARRCFVAFPSLDSFMTIGYNRMGSPWIIMTDERQQLAREQRVFSRNITSVDE